jgi:predicted membrane-bound mannosyltransferase
MYLLATEKMPWLLVNIALPMIVLSGRFLGEVLERVQWRRVIEHRTWLLALLVPLGFFVLWHIAFFGQGQEPAPNIALLGLWLAAAALVAGAMYYLAKHTDRRTFATMLAIPVAVMALVLTARTSWMASFEYGDVPVEMLVYTQTSPDVTSLMREIREAGAASGQNNSVPISIDQTSGFTWPWAWYLRDYEQVDYPSYSSSPLEQTPSASVLVIHTQNKGKSEAVLAQDFPASELIKHRWWFPEDTYRGLTLSKFIRSFGDRDSWRDAMDFFLFRKGIRERLGSEDAWVFFKSDFPQQFQSVTEP